MQIGLGTTDAAQDLMKLEYKYDTNATSYDNNGSMREQKIIVPTVGGTSGFTATQTYIYDDLNRIYSAEEKISGSTTWKQTFDIDRYGNRRFNTTGSNTTTLGSCSAAVCNPTISTSTNRISQSGYTFDANGSLTANAAGERFAYDAENHQTEYFDSSNSGSTPDATYYYDGEGRRVKKISSTETTVFVYDGGSQMIAEYSTALATTPQVSYLTQDHLGSPRVITNETGEVKDRKDFAAFGDETVTAARSSNLGYTSPADELREGYTGYEKDSESGLDFAQARYYNPTHGRFTSVDPLTASADIKNPQTFNRYSYVLNSPYKYVDPLGLISSSTGACGMCGNEDLYADGWSENYDSGQQTQQETPKSKPKRKPTKQRPSKPKAPPKLMPAKQTSPAAKKDGPKPISVTITPRGAPGPDGGKVGNVFKAGSMLIFDVSVQGDDGKPFQGIVSESVTSTVNGLPSKTETGAPVTLDNGQMVDMMAPAGIRTYSSMPTDEQIESAAAPMENTPMRLEQTATFTVTSPTTNATLTVVQTRTLTNLDGGGGLRKINPNTGSRFVYYPGVVKVTPNSP